MKKLLLPLTIALLFFINNTKAQAPKDISIPTSVAVQKSPAQITISWTTLSNATNIKVYRRNKGAATFILQSTLSPSATQFIDNSVTAGVEYEYLIYKTPTGSNPESVGYISSGIEVGQVDYRGTIILVIDSTFKTTLASSINTVKQDLIGDGWKVKSFYAKRTESVALIKSKILSLYHQDSVNTKAIYILGHVPVPYSGNLKPDGHSDHQGAWPADTYYADKTSFGWTDQWTNTALNPTQPSRAANVNIPSDGKFDYDDFPAPNYLVELQVGRVDLNSMPEFSGTETQLLAQYIARSHDYKHKVFNAQRRMLIDDNFGWNGSEAFAASGWRNGYSLFGGANVSANGYFSTLPSNDYLMSYACGGGTYSSCASVGTTHYFDSLNVKTVFNLLFGSYFGDWDSQDNFLRAPLASQGWSLASVWSGRPYWIMHHMSMGENIGFTTILTQNNLTEYKSNTIYGVPRGTYIALMGDPSLRLHTISPARNLVATPNGSHLQISLTWSASLETVLGYHVYRLNPSTGIYDRITTNMVTALTYNDASPNAGQNYYMVRAVKLETASGSYFNLSQGAFDTALSYTGIEPVIAANNIKLFPNPATNNLTIQFNNLTNTNNLTITLYDMIGKAVMVQATNPIKEGENTITLHLQNLTPGVYTSRFEFSNGYKYSEKLIIVRE